MSSLIRNKINRELFKSRKSGFCATTQEIPESYMLQKDVFLKITYNGGQAIIHLPLIKAEAIEVINALKKEFNIKE